LRLVVQRVNAAMIGGDHHQRIQLELSDALAHFREAAIDVIARGWLGPVVVGNQKSSMRTGERADNIHFQETRFGG